MIVAMLAAAAVAGPAVPSPGDVCGGPGTGEIVVCKHRDPGVESRYRLPFRDNGFDPNGPIDSASRAAHRLLDADGGAPDYTRGSCSAVGADGSTGCQIKAWRERDQQKGW